jgi:hypothetical protein
VIGAHAYGTISDYSTINKVDGPCMVCGLYSTCEIIRYEKVRHSFFVKLKVLERQYLFDWDKCGHRAVLDRPEDIARYRDEQDQTGVRSIPYYMGMRPRLEQMPKKPSALKIAVVLAGIFVVCVIVYLALNRFGLWPRFPVF